MNTMTLKQLSVVTLIACGLGHAQISQAEAWHMPAGVLKCAEGGTIWPPAFNMISDTWWFSDAGNFTLTDSTRPAFVLGGSGPWNMSLTSADPLGGNHTYLGVHFSLQAGGTPANSDTVFWFAHEPGTTYPGSSLLTSYWSDQTLGLGTATSVPVEITANLPDGLVFPRDYQFVYDNYVAPEPSVVVFLALGAFGVIGFRRRGQ